MNFDELINSHQLYEKRGRHLQEVFIINLLKYHVEQQGKSFVINKGLTQSFFDAFAPNGFDQFEKPTYIEINTLLSAKDFTWRIEKRFKNKLDYNQDAQFLFIFTRELGSDILDFVNSIKGNLKFDVWGPRQINELINKHVKVAKELGENLFSIHLESAINKEQSNWRFERDKIVDEITEAYKSGQFTLFLGAGVSSSAGLPDWDTLLNSLFVSMLTSELGDNSKNNSQEISNIVKTLRLVDGPSALMSARYIRKGMATSGSTEQTKFINAVTEQLYKLRDNRKPMSSNLIKSLAAICMPGRTGARVKSVVTYNFDDLLERELLNREIGHKTIFEEFDLPSQEELPIYHVHGYLPEKREQYSNLERCTLVFSEEGYHKIYNDPYHWSNLVQLNNLKETTCVMIGLSMTDPNLRRLLEISSRSIIKPKHYAFLKRININNFTKEINGKQKIEPTNMAVKFLDRHHSLNEEVLKELGVNIIWYEEYDEIPKILNKISKCIR